MSLLVGQTGIIASAAAPAGTDFAEVSTAASDEGSTVDPWDGSVTDPTGGNRLILDIFGSSAQGLLSSTLDPGGTANALTEDGEFIDTADTKGRVWGFSLLEASMPSGFGTKILRGDLDATDTGYRQIITLQGARQAVSVNGTVGGFSGSRTVDVTRNGGGDFPAGSIVYAFERTNNVSTITGDAAKVEDRDNGAGAGRFTYARGVLGAPKTTVSVTFDPDFSSSARARIVVVVEPAP